MAQFTDYHRLAGGANLLEPLLTLVGIALLLLAPFAFSRVVRARLRAWSRRRRERARVDDEVRARALMSELCPNGWSCRITLYDAPLPDERRPPGKVLLDWGEVRNETGEFAVMRRVYAPTIHEALEAMVADRQTDAALEQIELQATLDGLDWDD